MSDFRVSRWEDSHYLTLISVTVAALIVSGLLVFFVDTRLPATQPKRIVERGVRQSGELLYDVHLKPQSFLQPDDFQATQNYYSALVQDIGFTYRYDIQGTPAVEAPPVDYQVWADVGEAGVWQRSTTLVPMQRQTGAFEGGFVLPVSQYLDLLANAGGAYKVGSGNGQISLNVLVTPHLSGVRPFTQTLAIQVDRGQLHLGNDLQRTLVDEDSRSEQIPVAQTVLLRSIALAAVGVSILCFLIVCVRFLLSTRRPVDSAYLLTLLGRHYHQAFVCVTTLPPAVAQLQRVTVASLDGLARIAEELMRPVLVYCDDAGVDCLVAAGADGVCFTHRLSLVVAPVTELSTQPEA
jgi:hypothetical protein